MPRRKINLTLIIDGCLRGNRNSQRKLYEHFYGYSMNICFHYSKNREEAVEILNDSFLKIFKHLDKYDSHYPFEAWLRRIIINTAIDYYRARKKFQSHLELKEYMEIEQEEIPMPKLSPDEDMLPILQALSPAYRIVFILFAIEGYKHHEIAEKLGISVSSSRSNFVRAKAKLKNILSQKKKNIKMK